MKNISKKALVCFLSFMCVLCLNTSLMAASTTLSGSTTVSYTSDVGDIKVKVNVTYNTSTGEYTVTSDNANFLSHHIWEQSTYSVTRSSDTKCTVYIRGYVTWKDGNGKYYDEGYVTISTGTMTLK